MAPQVLVEQISRRQGPEPGHWLVRWGIHNLAQEPLQILAARLPHGKFRSDERELSPSPTLLPNDSAQMEFSVACSEPPGTVVENAFLILRVLWLQQPWRILIRFRVRFDEESGPQTVAELVTTQRVGFSVT